MEVTDEFVISDGKRYTKAEWEQIMFAERKVEEYDLLQLTKKIQL